MQRYLYITKTWYQSVDEMVRLRIDLDLINPSPFVKSEWTENMIRGAILLIMKQRYYYWYKELFEGDEKSKEAHYIITDEKFLMEEDSVNLSSVFLTSRRAYNKIINYTYDMKLRIFDEGIINFNWKKFNLTDSKIENIINKFNPLYYIDTYKFYPGMWNGLRFLKDNCLDTVVGKSIIRTIYETELKDYKLNLSKITIGYKKRKGFFSDRFDGLILTVEGNEMYYHRVFTSDDPDILGNLLIGLDKSQDSK